jgi:hypothetical protein
LFADGWMSGRPLRKLKALFAAGRLLLGLKPSRVFWHTVKLLSLRCADLIDLHGFAVQLVSGGGGGGGTKTRGDSIKKKQNPGGFPSPPNPLTPPPPPAGNRTAKPCRSTKSEQRRLSNFTVCQKTRSGFIPSSSRPDSEHIPSLHRNSGEGYDPRKPPRINTSHKGTKYTET